MLGGVSYWQYGFEQLLDWQASSNDRRLILVPGDDTEDHELMQSSSVDSEYVGRVWRFLRQGGALNNQQLFNFLAAEYFEKDILWHEPERLPHCMMYMPPALLSETSKVSKSLKYSQASFSDWQRRWQIQHENRKQDRTRHQDQDLDLGKFDTPAQQVCAVLFYRSHLQSANTAMFDDLISGIEQQGLQPLPIAIASLKDPESLALVNALIEQASVKLIINTTGFASKHGI